MTQCVFCQAQDNLNTQFTITIENGERVACDICDLDAEDATAKTVREAYLSKQTKIKELLEQAKAFGLDLVSVTQRPSGLIIPTSKTQPIQPPKSKNSSQNHNQVTNDLVGSDVVDTAKLDKARGLMSVGGSTEMGYVQSLPSHDMNSLHDKLPEEVRKGKAKMAIVEGRAGQQIAVPIKRVDGTGTTRVNVKQIENDSRLQNRFKSMAQASINNEGEPGFREGYQNFQIICPLCHGDMTVRNAGKDIECPKCHGSGQISVY